MLGGCDSTAAPAPAPAPVTLAIDPRPSTIAAADYIGPEACVDCHASEYARWSQSLHRKMNQRAADVGAVIGDFADASLTYRGKTVRFTHDAAGYAMTIDRARYRVTRTIGVRGLQEYVGVPDLAEDRRPKTGDPSAEVRLPFAWWPRRAGWYPQPYFDAWLDETTFDAFAPPTDPWATRCPWCHSTYPFAQRIARAAAKPVGHGLEQFFTGAPATDPDALRVAEQITTGISCESCHLGARAHAKDPTGQPMHFVPAGAPARPGAGAPLASQFALEKRDPAIVNAVCAQCHSGPTPRLADGSALRNSSEALDLASSRCTGIRCTDCHDPHRADARAETPRAIAACRSCHDQLAPDHGGHAADKATCLDCHMPRFVLGIDGFVRSHRISSPTDRTLLASAAPNACNLCHLDKPIAWTLAALKLTGIDTRAYTKGSVGESWLAPTSPPAIRLVAAAAYGRRGDRAHIAPLLVDPIAYLRAFAAFAYEDVLGRTLSPDEYDPRSPSLAHLPR